MLALSFTNYSIYRDHKVLGNFNIHTAIKKSTLEVIEGGHSREVYCRKRAQYLNLPAFKAKAVVVYGRVHG